MSRGPVSGTGSGGGFVARAVDEPRLAELRVEGFGSAGSVVGCSSFLAAVGCSSFLTSSAVVTGGRAAGVVARRPAGLRVRDARGVGVTLRGSGSAPFSTTGGAGDSDALASGVGSGVGAAATSVTGSGGSSIVAPTDDTRFVFLAALGVGVAAVVTGSV